MSSLSYNATVTASSEATATKQYCTNVINGVAAGSPYTNDLFPLYTNEWATVGEVAGAWIQLSWKKPIQANNIVLYDRSNFTDQIIRATLTFSNGSSIEVGPLPNNGSPYAVYFTTKTFSWVKLTVVEGKGYNIGLSEFDVYLV